ncbi:MFS transporter [Candidatus Woesearchaeota archaeon]|jgi:MFS family permease|nr:MFS transporter [Candidatus Woesearchaeota archaeon]MBT4114257.1 MFS transporter [Candidatus Woesearchaeota archaeon]MBT4248545.1 MFS transporter [Candidatus Woesearchaeota archaeon]
MNRKVILSALCAFNVALSFTLVSSFLPIYLDSMGISLVNIGLVFAFGAMVAGVLRFPIGTMADRVGRRPLMLFGAIGYPLFAIGVVLSRSTIHFIGIRLLIEVFGALFWIAFWAYIYDMIHRGHEGIEIAHTNMIIKISQILAPFIGGMIIAYYGFNHLFFLAAAVGAVNIIFISMVIKEYGKHERETLKKLEHDVISEYKHLVNMAKFRTLVIIGVLHNISWCIWWVYMPIYLRNQGTSIKQIGMLLSLVYLVSFMIQYPLGKAIDKFPAKFLIIPGFFLTWISGYAFLMFKDIIGYTIARASMSIGYDTEWSPLVARISHLTPRKEHGGTAGLFRAICALSVGIVTIIAGYLADIYGIKIVLWGASSFSLVVGIILLFVSKGLMGKGRSLAHKHHIINLRSASVHSEKQQDYIL